MLNLAHNPTKLIATGKSGSGKTLFINDWLFASRYNYAFIFDHDGQFSQRHGVRAAFNQEQILEQLRRWKVVVFNPCEMFISLKGDFAPVFKPTLDPRTLRMVKRFAGYGGAFDWFCRYAYKLSEKLPGTKILYCDEIQDIVDTSKCPEFVSRVLLSGRNRSLDFVGASLQYNFVHNEIRGQATTTIAFCTEEDLALQKLIERGFRAEQVRVLPPFHYILRDHRANVERRGKIFFKKPLTD